MVSSRKSTYKKQVSKVKQFFPILQINLHKSKHTSGYLFFPYWLAGKCAGRKLFGFFHIISYFCTKKK